MMRHNDCLDKTDNSRLSSANNSRLLHFTIKENVCQVFFLDRFGICNPSSAFLRQSRIHPKRRQNTIHADRILPPGKIGIIAGMMHGEIIPEKWIKRHQKNRYRSRKGFHSSLSVVKDCPHQKI